MQKYFTTLIIFFSFALISFAQSSGIRLPRFSVSPYFNEQVLTFSYSPEVTIQINAPAANAFYADKPTEVIFYPLPNGNTIEETVGKILKPGDDWHFDIQHIGAQTRFLREHDKTKNIVTVYLETAQLSWPSWRSKYQDNAQLINAIVDSVKNIFDNYNPFIVLSGHSGGGGFVFSYLNSVFSIPSEVKRINFLDSDYDYNNSYGSKIRDWLNASSDHYLCVLAYNDSIALYNGKPFVSPTGGTWYRSKMMQKYLSNYFTFTSEEDSSFIRYTALNGRIKFFLKKNPTRAILHTVQVELNGFIEGILSGTSLEGKDYLYYGSRAYAKWIQNDVPLPQPLKIPPRPANAITGSQFMKEVTNMTFAERENQIYNEVSKGNIPNFLRNLIMVKDTVKDALGVTHMIYYEVMPDYLAIGSNSNYCRIPTGPITAQQLGVLFGANLPTRQLVNNIYKNATLKLEPITYPWSQASVTIPKFQEHSYAIDSEIVAAGGIKGELTGGDKKDVVLSNKIIDPTRPNHVCIYGWHRLNGVPIQPLTNIHIDTYDDYSHGIRFINNQVLVDSVIMTVPQILKDPVLYKILSDEYGPMVHPSYIMDSKIPNTPESFGVVCPGSNQLRIIVSKDSLARQYYVYLSNDGINFGDPLILSPDNLTINNLKNDSIYYVKIKAVNTAGESSASVVLAAIPVNISNVKILIINGYKGVSGNNSINFIIQNGNALLANGYNFESATSQAVADGLFPLSSYGMVDYILGDESTADETISSAGQAIVKDYLDGGGNVFLSGSNVAWALDFIGRTSDKNFIKNFLKMKFVADAPNGKEGVYYEAEPVVNSIAKGIPQFFFDNGTHGTINVISPDIVSPVNGGMSFMKFSGIDTSSGVCGIYFSGIFPNGSKPGKVVSLTFPFETIYPKSIRTQLMGQVLNFISPVAKVKNENEKQIPSKFTLYQNYPNPFNPSTVIKYYLPEDGLVLLNIYDELGRLVKALVNKYESKGTYKVNFNGMNYASGIYYYRLRTENFISTKKMILIK